MNHRTDEDVLQRLVEAEQRAADFYALLLEVHKVLTDNLLASSPAPKKRWGRGRPTPKALKQIRELASLVQHDISNILAYGNMDKVPQEKEALRSIEVRLQAILRYANEALSAPPPSPKTGRSKQ